MRCNYIYGPHTLCVIMLNVLLETKSHVDPMEVNTVFTLVLQTRKPKPRVSMRGHWALNSGLPDAKSSNWTYYTTFSLHMVVSRLSQWDPEARSLSLQIFVSWLLPDKTLQVF